MGFPQKNVYMYKLLILFIKCHILLNITKKSVNLYQTQTFNYQRSNDQKSGNILMKSISLKNPTMKRTESISVVIDNKTQVQYLVDGAHRLRAYKQLSNEFPDRSLSVSIEGELRSPSPLLFFLCLNFLVGGTCEASDDHKESFSMRQ